MTQEISEALTKCSTEINEKLCDEIALEAYNLRSEERDLLNSWREVMPDLNTTNALDDIEEEDD